MKNFVKYLLFVLALALFVCVTAMVRMQARERRHLTTCKHVEINFEDTLNFVSEADVRGYLKKDFPTFIGQRIDSLRLHEIEHSLDSRSAILSTQAWTSDSTLFISIVQREPAARLENTDHSFYIDDRGFIFPIQGECTKKFPVIKGSLPLYEPVGYKGQPTTEKGREWTESMLKLLSQMHRNKWEDRLKHIEVAPDGCLTLVPLEGKEHFIFGKAENTAEKFEKINEYYTRIKPAVDEDYYTTVNVQYKGQIICRK